MLLHKNADRIRLPKLKYCKALSEYIHDANQIVNCISKSETAELLYAVAYAITERLGYSVQRSSNSSSYYNIPPWERRLGGK